MSVPRRGGARGFARMSPERRRLISQRGNARLREQGREHRFTSDEAREAVERKQELDERRQAQENHEESQHQGSTARPSDES